MHVNEGRHTRKTRRAGLVLTVILCPCVLCAEATLKQQKDQFAALMSDRAALAKRARRSMEIIREARRTTGPGVQRDAPAARAYRDAVLQVEKALDEHPRIERLREQREELLARKRELGEEMAAVVDARRDAREERVRALNDAIGEASRRAAAERQAILKQAGVTSARELSGNARQRFADVHQQLTNEVARVKRELSPDGEAGGGVQDEGEITARFEELKARYEELEQERDLLRASILAMRKTLRREDPAVAKLHAAAREASRAYVAGRDAAPEVAEAREFLGKLGARRVVIDEHALALWQTIVAEDPGYRDTLKQQARAAGLVLANVNANETESSF